ncbi:hypothetical protein [Streptomyces sp. NPDC001970]
MGLPGGSADKVGNQYEDWWTALRVTDLLDGSASWIRLEPPGKAGKGIEFEIAEPDGPWCEQVKDVPSKGPWTLAAVGTILEKVGGHLAAGKKVRLVLSTGAPKLHDLSERARAAATLEEFRDVLTKDQKNGELTTVIRHWKTGTGHVDELTGWQYLSAIYVEQHAPETLRRLVTAAYSILISGDSELIVNELRGFLGDHLHKRITGTQVWNRLLAIPGVQRRLLAGDTGTLTALASTADRFLRRVNRSQPSFGLAARPHTRQLYERVTATDGPQVIVCEGGAGAGKSTVAADVLTQLKAQGLAVAAVRMDGIGANVQTAKALGTAMELPDSPAVLLAGVADGEPAYLLVDQLDAVSSYSGRMPDAYEAVEDVLEQLRVAPNVKVLLVARSVDVDNDRRLTGLVSDSRVERFSLGLLDEADVRAVLCEDGTDPDVLGRPTLQLLRVPLHLSVFARLSPQARTGSYRTLQELYECYTNDVRTEIENQLGTLDWPAITNALCSAMSEREMLQVPAATLDPFPRRQVSALESYAVLFRDGGKVQFFHETYFDYLFARAFTAGDDDVHSFLAASGQHLFRRAQTRQILEHLAGTDRPRFRTTVAQLLTSDQIRPHLHEVIIAVLRQLDATDLDWQAIEPIAWGTSRAARRARSLLSLPRWFGAADHDGRWERWLAAPDTAEAAFRELITAAKHHPERTAELVRPHLATTPQWQQWLRTLIEWSLTPPLVDLAIELIDRGQLDDARGPIAVNSDFWSLLYSIAEDDPSGTARIVGAYLRRCGDRARHEGSGDPFESEYLPLDSQTASTVISRVSSAAPSVFVREVLPFVMDVAAASSQTRAYTPPGGRWAYRYIGSRSVDGILISGLDTALRTLPATDPLAAADALQQLSPSNLTELRILTCRLYTAGDDADAAIDWLLSDEDNLTLGWADSSRWVTRELIDAATPKCTQAAVDRLTAVLLTYYPAWEHRRTKGMPSAWGLSQYELLSAICPDRRSAAVRGRLAEWERKFPGHPKPPQEITATFVDSPISDAAAAHMTDAQWNRALKRYAAARTHGSWQPRGSAQELAQTLGIRAAQEPERFTALALQLAPGSPPVYLTTILHNVAPHIDADPWTELALHIHRTIGTAAAGVICRALESAPENYTSALYQLLNAYTADPDPAGDIREADEEGARQDLLTAGMNSTRGQTALALATVLFHGNQHTSSLIPLVQRMADDPVLAVRTCAAEAVMALIRHAQDTALDAAERLFSHPDPNIYNAQTTQRLLTYALLRSPDRFANHLARALHGPGAAAELAGQVWAIAAVRDCLTSQLPAVVQQLSDRARRGAAATLAHHPDQFGLLTALFEDSDADTRKNASAVLRQVFEMPVPQASELIEAFLNSAAFRDHQEHLVFALHNHTGPLPAVALDACERIVELAGDRLGDITSHRAVHGHYLVSIVLRLYRQSSTSQRGRCLDIIDRLSLADVTGLSAALEGER